MKTKQQIKEKATAKFLINALTTILVSYSLLLKGVKMLREKKEEPQDTALAILKEIEPRFYISVAGLLMLKAFGKEHTEIRDAADKCVVDMVKAQLKIEEGISGESSI